MCQNILPFTAGKLSNYYIPLKKNSEALGSISKRTVGTITRRDRLPGLSICTSRLGYLDIKNSDIGSSVLHKRKVYVSI